MNNGSEATSINLFGIFRDREVRFHFWKSQQTCVASTGDMKKTLIGRLVKLLNCSAMSNLLVNVLSFIVILEGEVCPFVFRLI